MSHETLLEKLEEEAPIIIWRGSAGGGHPKYKDGTRLVEIYPANLDGTAILEEDAEALGKGTSLIEAASALKTKLPRKPPHSSLISPMGTIGECNTSDITFQDCCLLDRQTIPEVLYRNEYGYILFCKPQTQKAAAIAENLGNMRELGFSEKFLEVLKAAQAAGHRYLVIDQAARPGREETDPSWNNAEKEEFAIDSVEAIKPTAKALSKEALEEIFEYVAGGLWIDLHESGQETINPKKTISEPDLKTHLENILKKHGVTPK